jgi:tetratricopeptide (TPR) repeat protein
MKKISKVLFAASVLVMLNSTVTIAQESCTEKLYRANNLYEKGKIQEAIEIASTCTSSENVTDQWQAYHLLAMAYLADNKPGDARKAAEKMLEINPTYEPSKLKDPAELIRLLKSIKVIPKFSMGLAATVGGNITYPRVTATYNGANYKKTYSSKGSWQMGIIIGYNMNEIISLHTGLIATSKKIGVSYQVGDNNISINENMTYLDVPLFARFTTLPIKGIRFFGDAGIYTGRLTSSKSDFSRQVKNTDETFTEDNLNSENRRNKWEYGSILGGGAVVKLGKVNVAIDAKYYIAAFYNMTNEDNRYKNENLFYSYYFIDDDTRLNNLAISLSLVYNVSYRVIKGK